jgi:hypothetical protein
MASSLTIIAGRFLFISAPTLGLKVTHHISLVFINILSIRDRGIN